MLIDYIVPLKAFLFLTFFFSFLEVQSTLFRTGAQKGDYHPIVGENGKKKRVTYFFRVIINAVCLLLYGLYFFSELLSKGI
jgi:hypothetical protein